MGLNRRKFLTMAMSFGAGATAGALASPLPWKLLDDASIWTQNWSWIPALQPGANTYAHAVSKTCPSAAAVTVRLVGGRPVRVLPNHAHPFGGGVTSLAAAELQLLHSPARVKKPLLRVSKSDKNPATAFKELTWSEAAALLHEKLQAAGGKVAFISGDLTGSVNEVISAFADAIGSSDVFLMPSDEQSAFAACDVMGISAGLGYDIENSDYVFAAGANILETWGTVVRNRRAFAASRPHPDKSFTRPAIFSYAGPMQNNTAAVARPWLAIYPGTETALLLGIAAGLIAAGKTAKASDFSSFTKLVSRFTPEETARLTGVSVEKLSTVINDLLKAKRPLVIAGSECGQGGGLAPVVVAFAINALLGNINKKGGIQLLPEEPSVLAGAVARRELYRKDLLKWLGGKPKPEVLILNEANPAYALPDPKSVREALVGIPFKISFTSFMDETATDCDLILPVPMGFERIDDVINPYGCSNTTYCTSLPVSMPNADTRPAADTLLFVAKQFGKDLGVQSYEDLLKKKAILLQANFDVLVKGVPAENDTTVIASSFVLRPELLENVVFGHNLPEGDSCALSIYAKLNLGTAATGIPPFSVKTLRAAELDGRDMAMMMNAATAQKYGLAEGMRIKLERKATAGESAQALASVAGFVRIFEGVINDTVAVCSGFGHTAFDAFSQNKGANIMELLRPAPESGSELSTWAATRVVIVKA